MEERPDVQKQILADIAKKLPIFTRAQSGGQSVITRVLTSSLAVNGSVWCDLLYLCVFSDQVL